MDVETQNTCPRLAACASLWRLPSPVAMTHVRWLHSQRGHESTDCAKERGPLCRCFVLGLSIRAQTRTRAKVNVRPRPTVCKPTGVEHHTAQDLPHNNTDSTACIMSFRTSGRSRLCRIDCKDFVCEHVSQAVRHRVRTSQFRRPETPPLQRSSRGAVGRCAKWITHGRSRVSVGLAC